MMCLLNSSVEFHLGCMEIIHGNLMGIQYVPDHTQRKGGLLEPLTQLLKGLGLRETIDMTMGTHGIDLKGR